MYVAYCAGNSNEKIETKMGELNAVFGRSHGKQKRKRRQAMVLSRRAVK